MSSPVVRVLAWVAVVIQALLTLHYLVLGLGWGGVWWAANLGQGVLLLGVTVLAAFKRPLLALLVPLLSVALMFAMQSADRSMDEKLCPPAAKQTVRQLGWLPGADEELWFMAEPGSGCVARFNSALPPNQVLDHYRSGALEAGWRETADPTPERIEVSNADWTVAVRVNHGDRGMYVLAVYRVGGAR